MCLEPLVPVYPVSHALINLRPCTHVPMQAVAEHGKVWKLVAEAVTGRTSQQCRERYENKLNPEIKVEVGGPFKSVICSLCLPPLYSSVGRAMRTKF